VTETPQAVTVIDQEMIKASGAREFAELFRLVPGFTVSYATHVKGLQPIVNRVARSELRRRMASMACDG